MKYINLALTVIFVLSLCRCSTLDDGYLHYPMQIVSMRGFTKEQKKKIRRYSDELNQLVGKNVIVHEASDQHIKVSYQPFIPSNKKDQTTLGTMIMDDKGNCIIKLTQTTLSDDDWLHVVVWHEIGHCVGLEHVEQKHEVMSPLATPYTLLTRGAINRFAKSLNK